MSPVRKGIAYQAVLLGGFSTLAAALLMLGNVATREDIAASRRNDMLLSLSQVIPAALHDNDLLSNTLSVTNPAGTSTTIYRAIRKSSVTGVAFQVSSNGYAGPIDLIMAVDPKGKLLGVRVLAHAETPGLGDRIEPEKSNWIRQFKGLSLQNTPERKWLVKKDGGVFDQFSGATITPRAVVKAIRQGLDFFRDHRALLLMPPDSGKKQRSADD